MRSIALLQIGATGIGELLIDTEERWRFGREVEHEPVTLACALGQQRARQLQLRLLRSDEEHGRPAIDDAVDDGAVGGDVLLIRHRRPPAR
jgi:hypothetical protein